jgi:hypothetical protein
VGIRRADLMAPSFRKLALTSPTSGGRSVGIVLSRTQATEFSFSSCVRKETHVTIVNTIWPHVEGEILRSCPSCSLATRMTLTALSREQSVESVRREEISHFMAIPRYETVRCSSCELNGTFCIIQNSGLCTCVSHVRWDPCPHSMARPRVADGGTASRYGG